MRVKCEGANEIDGIDRRKWFVVTCVQEENKNSVSSKAHNAFIIYCPKIKHLNFIRMSFGNLAQ